LDLNKIASEELALVSTEKELEVTEKSCVSPFIDAIVTGTDPFPPAF
jgi:hypothetical protein